MGLCSSRIISYPPKIKTLTRISRSKIPQEIVVDNILIYLPLDELLKIRIFSKLCQRLFVDELVRRYPQELSSITHIITRTVDKDLFIKLSPKIPVNHRVQMMRILKKEERVWSNHRNSARSGNMDYFDRRYSLLELMLVSAPIRDVPKLMSSLPHSEYRYFKGPYIPEDEFIDKFYQYFHIIYGSWGQVSNPKKVFQKFEQEGAKVPEHILLSYLCQHGTSILESLRKDPTIVTTIVLAL